MTKDACSWARDGDGDVWSTRCGHYFIVNEGTPEENDFHYCPFCGGSLVQEPDEQPDSAGGAA